jgi:long-chain acyl-CoA synthetase
MNAHKMFNEKIAEKIVEHARHSPDRLAIRCGDNFLTYSDLYKVVLNIINVIAPKTRKIRTKNSTILILTENSVDFVPLFISSILAYDRVAIGDVGWSKSQLTSVIEKLDPDLIYTRKGHPYLPDLLSIRSSKVITDLPALSGEPQPVDHLESRISRRHFLTFTSGTTGIPKIVAMSFEAWLLSLENCTPLYKPHLHEEYLGCGFISYGLMTFPIIESIFHGNTFDIMDKYGGKDIYDRIGQKHDTRIIATPNIIKRICIENTTNPMLNVKSIVTSSAPLTTKHIELARIYFPNSDIYDYYGSSEYGFVSCRQITKTDQKSFFFPGVDIEFRPIPDIKDEFEIGISSPYVFDGYIGFNGEIVSKGDENYISIGDVGKIDKEGKLIITRRMGDVFSKNGIKIYPTPLEEIIRTFPGISDALVFGMEGTEDTDIAVIIDEDENGISDHVFNEACARSMNLHEIPQKIFRVESFIRTPLGKTDRGKTITLIK